MDDVSMYISGITAFGVPGSLDELSSDLIAESYGIRMAAIQRTIDLKNCVNGKTVLRERIRFQKTGKSASFSAKRNKTVALYGRRLLEGANPEKRPWKKEK